MLTEEETEVFDLIQAGENEKALDRIRSGSVRINCLDKSGMNYLDQAAFKGNEKLVESLLELGADIDNRKHNHGYTCLMFGALSGNTKLCELLLNAGARSHPTNNMGKTATEMAAFVGNFECVSLINSYISYEDINVLVHPNGEKSDVVYPKEFVEYIHKLTRTHLIHPVSIANGLLNNPLVLERRKKLVYVVDRLFEKQMRCKQPNEIMALKLWVILTTLREISTFLQSKLADNNDNSEESLKQTLKLFIKQINEWKVFEGKVYRAKLEPFLAALVGGFPYKHSVAYSALAQSMKHLEFGKAPNIFTLICGAFFGQRYAQSAFCSYCGQANAVKCCSVCKVVYCSAECQKSDWSSHKKVCSTLKENPHQNAYLMPSPSDELTNMTLNENEGQFDEEKGEESQDSE